MTGRNIDVLGRLLIKIGIVNRGHPDILIAIGHSNNGEDEKGNPITEDLRNRNVYQDGWMMKGVRTEVKLTGNESQEGECSSSFGFTASWDGNSIGKQENTIRL